MFTKIESVDTCAVGKCRRAHFLPRLSPISGDTNQCLLRALRITAVGKKSAAENELLSSEMMRNLLADYYAMNGSLLNESSLWNTFSGLFFILFFVYWIDLNELQGEGGSGGKATQTRQNELKQPNPKLFSGLRQVIWPGILTRVVE